MSVRTDVINLNVNINGDAARNKLNELRKSAADIKVEMQDLKKGTEAFAAKKAELAAVATEMSNLKQEIGLTSLNQKELANEIKKLSALRGSATPFTEEWKQYDEQLQKVQNRHYEVKNGVQGLQVYIHKMSQEIKDLGMLAVGYLGFEFLTSQVHSILSGSGKISDSLAQMKIYLHGTTEDAQELYKALRQIDTRTSNADLLDIATIVAKKGVAKEEIVGVTKALDQLFVVLGKEVGDPHEAVASLVKLVNVYSEDHHVTATNIGNIGAAIQKLTSSGVATGDFLINFAERLAGVRGVTGITIQSVLGLGSALQELGQRNESASTAAQKLIIQMFLKPELYARAAGMSIKDFSATLAKDPVEALIKVAGVLKQTSQAPAELIAEFQGMEISGARVFGVLGDIAGNADYMRKRLKDAQGAFGDTGSITDAFNEKNVTLGATLDKIGKVFNSLWSSSSVNSFLKSAAEGLLSFLKGIKELPQWISENRVAFTFLTGVLLTYLATKTKLTWAIVQNKVATLLETGADKIEAAQKAVNIALTKAYAFAKGVLTGEIKIATIAQRLWNAAINANPLVLLLSLLTAVGTAVAYFSSKMQELTAAEQVHSDLQKKIIELTGDEEIKSESLFKTLQQKNLSYDAKKKLLADLIAINPEYLKGLTLENVTTAEGARIMQQYINKLREANTEKARQALITEKEKQKQESLLKLGNTKIESSDFGMLGNIKDAASMIGIGKGTGTKQLGDVFNEVTKLNNELDVLYKETAAAASKTATEASKVAGEATQKETIRTIALIKKQIEELDKAFENISVTDKAGLKKNRAERKKLQDELDALEGKGKGENKYKELRAKFDELIRELNEQLGKNTLNPMEAEFIKISEECAKQIALIQDLAAKHAITAKEAQAAMDLIRQNAFAANDKAYEKEVERIRKLRKIGPLLELPKLDSEKIFEDFAKKIDKEHPKDTGGDLRRRNERNTKAGLELDVLRSPKLSQKKLDAELALLREQEEQELQQKDLTENEIALIEEKYRQKKAAAIATHVQDVSDFTVRAATQLNQLLSNIENARLNKEIAANDIKKKSYKKQLDNKLISEKQYSSQVEKLDQDLDKKKKKLQYEQAKRQKAIDIAQGLANTAIAVIGFLGAKPVGPWNFVEAAIAGAMGLANVATIAANPLPELGTGGWVKDGATHAEGGINANIEKNEAVMKASAMTDPSSYTVTGTAAQITSALNSNAGGVSWTSGATLQPAWRTQRPATLNPSMPSILATGGFNSNNTAVASSVRNNDTALLQQLVKSHQEFREEVSSWQGRLHTVYTANDVKQQKIIQNLYTSAQKAAGLND